MIKVSKLGKKKKTELIEKVINASQTGDLKFIQDYLLAGGNLEIKNYPLQTWSVIYGHLHIVKFLKQNNLDFSFSHYDCLSFAIKKDRFEIFKYLIGDNISEHPQIQYFILTAVNYDNLVALKFMAQNGANLSFEDNKVFKEAIRQNRKKMIMYFVIEQKQNIDEVLKNSSLSKEILDWAKNYKILHDMNIKLQDDLKDNLSSKPIKRVKM